MLYNGQYIQNGHPPIVVGVTRPNAKPSSERDGGVCRKSIARNILQGGSKGNPNLLLFGQGLFQLKDKGGGPFQPHLTLIASTALNSALVVLNGG